MDAHALPNSPKTPLDDGECAPAPDSATVPSSTPPGASTHPASAAAPDPTTVSPTVGPALSSHAHVHGISHGTHASPSASASASAGANTNTGSGTGTDTGNPCVFDSSNLFVGDLQRDVTEEDLVDAFAKYGHVVECIVKRSKVNGLPLGYGFVKMQQHVEAENALEGLNNSLLRGRPIRVGWARRNSSCLYIEGLCPSVTAEDLNTAFAPFGELKQSKTTVTPSESSDMNNGTVHFTFRDSAMLAKGRMNGQVLGELPIVVEWGQLPSSSDRYGGGGGGGGGGCYGRNNNGHGFHSKIYNGHGHGHGHGHGFMERGAVDQDLYTTYEELGPAAPAVSLYVNFHTVAPGIDITEEVIFSLFAQFTSPVSVHIKSCTVDMASPGHQRGYAFVHFASSDVGREQAMHVVKTARDVVLDGVHLTSELSKNFRRGMAPGSYPCQKKEQQQHYRQEQQHLHQQQYAMFPQQSHMQMGGRSGMSPRMTGMNAMYAQPQYYVAPSMGMGADMAYGAAGYYHEMDASLAPQMAFDFSGVQSSMAYPYPTGPAYHYQQRGSGNGNGGNGGNGGSGGGGGGGGGNLPSKGGAATAYPEGTHGGGGGGGGSGSGNGHGGSITVQLAPPP